MTKNDPHYAELLAATDTALGNWIAKTKTCNEISDQIIHVHKLYHQALEEQSIAERELKIARRTGYEYTLLSNGKPRD